MFPACLSQHLDPHARDPTRLSRERHRHAAPTGDLSARARPAPSPLQTSPHPRRSRESPPRSGRMSASCAAQWRRRPHSATPVRDAGARCNDRGSAAVPASVKRRPLSTGFWFEFPVIGGHGSGNGSSRSQGVESSAFSPRSTGAASAAAHDGVRATGSTVCT